MERALKIDRASELRLWRSDYRRIYFGDEFCNRKIPTVAEIERLLDFIYLKNIKLTLVTPYCTDTEIGEYRKIIDSIKKHPGLEVVINDWGFYRLCKDSNFKIALGRLLVKQRRDPRIPEFINTVPPKAKKRLKDIGLNGWALNFLKKERIGRIELDNVLQGMNLDNIDNDFVFSLHVPFIYISLTRYCGLDTNLRGERFKIKACDKQCKFAKIHNKRIKTPIFMHGNAFFYENRALPDGVEQSKIDRIVYTA